MPANLAALKQRLERNGESRGGLTHEMRESGVSGSAVHSIRNQRSVRNLLPPNPIVSSRGNVPLRVSHTALRAVHYFPGSGLPILVGIPKGPKRCSSEVGGEGVAPQHVDVF